MKKIRVLIAKPGLDGHDRGAIVISQALRDHGMEVIYTGLRQSPLQIAQAAIQEDVDVVGLSSLSGAHKTLFPAVVEELKKLKAEDIPVIGGGVIPSQDVDYLIERGIKKVFTSGTPTTALIQYIEQLVNPEKVKQEPEKIAHIGIAVKSIDDALNFYVNILGLRLEKLEKVPREGVKVAFLPLGESYIELLEPIDSTSPVHQFIEKKGEGIHHIALKVANLSKRIEEIQEKGLQMVHEQPVTGANQSKIAFIHPSSAHGVLYELCEFEEDEEQ